MNPKARLKVTLNCNRTCAYCINKHENYRQKWHPINLLSEVDWNRYRTVIISGGEPTYMVDTLLIMTLKKIRLENPDPMIYLQTNGYRLTKELVNKIDYYIDAIGLSIHDVSEFLHMLPRWKDINRIKPIRLYIEDKKYDELIQIIKGEDFLAFDWKIWEDGEFDSKEDIFVMKGQ